MAGVPGNGVLTPSWQPQGRPESRGVGSYPDGIGGHDSAHYERRQSAPHKLFLWDWSLPDGVRTPLGVMARA